MFLFELNLLLIKKNIIMGTIVKMNGTVRVIETEKLGCGTGSYVRSSGEGYDQKIKRFFKHPDYVNYVTESMELSDGDLVQMQNPSRYGEAIVDCGPFGKRANERIYLENVLIISGDANGCYNYVATLNQSKNSGQYQKKAQRVRESATYLVKKKLVGYSWELLLDNLEWLDAEKSEEALGKLAKAKLCKSTSPTEIRSCKIKTDKFSLDLKIARVKKVKSFKGEEMMFVVSLNSGKIWLLPAEQVELGEDVSRKKCIMTQFVWLRQVGTSGNFYISE